MENIPPTYFSPPSGKTPSTPLSKRKATNQGSHPEAKRLSSAIPLLHTEHYLRPNNTTSDGANFSPDTRHSLSLERTAQANPSLDSSASPSEESFPSIFQPNIAPPYFKCSTDSLLIALNKFSADDSFDLLSSIDSSNNTSLPDTPSTRNNINPFSFSQDTMGIKVNSLENFPPDIHAQNELFSTDLNNYFIQPTFQEHSGSSFMPVQREQYSIRDPFNLLSPTDLSNRISSTDTPSIGSNIIAPDNHNQHQQFQCPITPSTVNPLPENAPSFFTEFSNDFTSLDSSISLNLPDIEKRYKAICDYTAGKKKAHIAHDLGKPWTTICRWINEYKTTGDWASKQQKTRINTEQLESALQQDPNATLEQIKVRLGLLCTTETVGKNIRRLGYVKDKSTGSRKKVT